MRAIIFANGIINRWPEGLKIDSGRDLLIAANGGLHNCLARDYIPHVVVGDLDSVSRSDLDHLEDQGVEIVTHPTRKDETDLELALKLACNRDIQEIIILGALGARWDMTLSNVINLAASFLSDVKVRLLEGCQEIVCLRGGQKAEFYGRTGDMLSLLPLGDAAKGVSLAGLEFLLHNETLPLGTTRGMSNVFTGSRARVELKEGCLLVVINRSKLQ